MSNATDRELSPTAIAAMSAIAKYVVILAAEKVPIGQVLERAMPGLACPAPICPHCGEHWTVRNSRQIGDTHLYKQWMLCSCESTQSRIVDKQFVKLRGEKQV